MRSTWRSDELFKRAQQRMPGGVNSPVRAFKAVGGTPPFITQGEGPRIRDADGNEYIDYVCSWGPLILGHAHPGVVAAVTEAARKGFSFGASTETEVELAETICQAMPSIEKIRLVSSGTEAAMSALRLCRAYTGRDKVVKFAGGYHGHSDGLLVKAGSGATTLGIPDSPGVPRGCAENTLVATYNNLETVAELFERCPMDIAAVIVEPAAANMGLVKPQPGFLHGLREMTLRQGALLVFDEVITGFRLSYGGAQGLFGVTPDITCLGKVIGGGMPIGAYGGRKDIMAMVAPEGPVYQAGTLSGNPLATTAGLATLRILGAPGTYERLEKLSARMEDGIVKLLAGRGATFSRLGSLMTVFFTAEEVRDYSAALRSDLRRFAAFFNHLLNSGIYWPPSQFEAAFVSLAHTGADIDQTVLTISRALTESDLKGVTN